MAEDIDIRVAVHEAICTERYQAIEKRLEDGSKRMRNIEVWQYITLGAVLLGPGAMAEFIKKFFGF